MKCVTVRLNMVENLNQFISIVNRYPYKISLRSGRKARDGCKINPRNPQPGPEEAAQSGNLL